MASSKNLKKPQFLGCHKTSGRHTKTAWTCRACKVEACAECAHHFGKARSPVPLEGPCERLYTCSKCSRERLIVGGSVCSAPPEGNSSDGQT